MKNNYFTVGACLLLFFTGLNNALAQTGGPEFLDCHKDPISLCVSDEGVRLPGSNQIYKGDLNPEATSCSVHVLQKMKVRSSCGKSLQYEVQVFINDSPTPFTLKSPTLTFTDSLSEVELTYDTESSPEHFIREDGLPYTNRCANYHRIKWIVRDSCGNENICEQYVDLYDCFQPQIRPVAGYNILYFNASQHMVVHPQNFILSAIDDCTKRGKFSYSFSPVKYQPDTSFWVCGVPALGVELDLSIWVADEGSDLNCDGIIEWQERNRYQQDVFIVFVDIWEAHCELPDVFLGGEIETDHLQAVNMVQVNLESPVHVFLPLITNTSGQYGIYDYYFPANLTVRPERNDNHKNGVSTLDLVKINKHLLGIESINSPYDLIAADANNSQNVSAIDMIELRKLILGRYNEFPHCKSWRFVPENFHFSDVTYPFPFPESVEIQNATFSSIYLDFIGIKIGDVNNTVQANAHSISDRSEMKFINWTVEQHDYVANEIIEINFSIDHTTSIQGFQVTISSPDLEFIDASSQTIDLTEENFALFNDKITLSWFNEDGNQFSKEDIVFTLKARAKSNGNLKQNLSINSDITEAEAYSMQDEILIPKLIVLENEPGNHPILFSPEPNPWREKTKVPFYLYDAGEITFEVFDLNGRPIYTDIGSYKAGYNEIIISDTDFASRGVLYYSIRKRDSVSTSKMIVIE